MISPAMTPHSNLSLSLLSLHCNNLQYFHKRKCFHIPCNKRTHSSRSQLPFQQAGIYHIVPAHPRSSTHPPKKETCRSPTLGVPCRGMEIANTYPIAFPVSPSGGLIAKAIYHNTSSNVLFQSPGHKQ
ncbi:hypothetical protein DSO57_1023245 [Entomophthora muscae]|uniref:Uncharacterized protein n=1 Tax=Entomophthora muscae TaxID=34485 RepID=A0ACC2RHR2_9FUNG|nr:hypothetical protein DSO57_1023245 [Entomophthora muscae]